MSKDAPSDIPESTAQERPLPEAWQPLTPRGVAAFSRARIGRLFVVQLVVALMAAGVVLWFLATAWFPTLLEAIHQLPPTGVIEARQLSSPRASTVPLAESRFL